MWVRRITAELRPALAAAAGRPGETDAELAAWLWLAQMQLYAAALPRFANARSLDATALFDQPRETLTAAFASVRPGGDTRRTIDAIVAGSLFATYSKNPDVAFDNAARQARRAAGACRPQPKRLLPPGCGWPSRLGRLAVCPTPCPVRSPALRTSVAGRRLKRYPSAALSFARSS